MGIQLIQNRMKSASTSSPTASASRSEISSLPLLDLTNVYYPSIVSE